VARKASVRDNVISFGEDQVIFVAECIGKAANEIEQAIAAGRNVRAVLNVVRRPEALRSGELLALWPSPRRPHLLELVRQDALIQ
jgi:hypothetical protein